MAGRFATQEDLIDVDALIGAYYDEVPDPSVALRTCGIFGYVRHRGSL